MLAVQRLCKYRGQSFVSRFPSVPSIVMLHAHGMLTFFQLWCSMHMACWLFFLPWKKLRSPLHTEKRSRPYKSHLIFFPDPEFAKAWWLVQGAAVAVSGSMVVMLQCFCFCSTVIILFTFGRILMALRRFMPCCSMVFLELECISVSFLSSSHSAQLVVLSVSCNLLKT